MAMPSLEKAARGEGSFVAEKDDAELVRLFREEPDSLIALADAVCRSIHGDAVYVRGLLEITNRCARDCAYCGLRSSNRGVHRYRMDVDEILERVKRAFDSGMRSFVLQGGEDGYLKDDEVAAIVSAVKGATRGEAAVALSLGVRTRASYKALRDAGADRYLMRFETSDPTTYASLKGGERLERRIEALMDLRDLGYELGSGFMTGLPGETEDTVIANAFLCRELDLDMVGIGPFIPHPETPLNGEQGSSMELAERATALVRCLLPFAHMPATTAAGSLDPRGRERMWMAGANVVMPNIGGSDRRKDYLLYPGKICLDEDFTTCMGCLSLRVAACGKRLDLSKAPALRRKT